MQKLKLNETPVRTSRNFNINNIEIEKANIRDEISLFNNVQIIGETVNIKKTEKLTYGLNNTLENQVRKNANQKIGFEVENENKQISFKFDNDNLDLVEDIRIIARKDSNATVTIRYESEKEVEAYHNGIIRVIAEENSKLNVIIVNLMNDNSQNFLSIENTLEDNSNVTYTIVDIGAKNSITNYYANLLGKESNNNINTIYLGNGEELLDLNYITELRGEKSNVNLEVQGALKDVAKKHFKGTIDFKRGAKKAKGNENESCMMLSDKAKSLALPMLLCSEEDVEGNHSTSSGKIGQKELFYIMSRGFSYKAAMKLLVRAKFNSILETIEDEKLKEKILSEIDKRLN